MAPDGDDAGPGTSGSPFATIQRARDVVRARIAGGMTENITVHIGAGNYFIESPLVFDNRDGGRNGHTITYQGAPGLQTRIYGGRRITGWTRLNDTEFSAIVADLQQHYTLYENERSANGGIFHTFADAPEGNWRKNGTQLIYRPRNLPIEDQVIVLGTAKDVFMVMGPSGQESVSNLIFDSLHMIGSDFASEWKQGVTGYPAFTGEYDGMQWNNKTLGVIQPDMRHGQFFIQNARNIVIRNSKLYGAGFMAAFFHRRAESNRVENCWIENAGCNGLFFQGWECGRGASDGITTLAGSYVNKWNVVTNNVFHDIGRFAFDGAGIVLVFSGDNRIEHNVFNGITRYGISTKGWRPKMINTLYRYALMDVRDPANEPPYDANWIIYYDGYVVTEANQGTALNHSRNNIIRYNDFSQIARSGDDMGMIEMWGAGTGNIWEYNSCHDGVNTASWNTWMHALFNDDGSHSATVRGNILFWLAGGEASRAIMSKGNDQNNIHNIIADCDLNAAATIGPYAEQAHNMVWSRNIVASKMGSLYSGGSGTETVGGVAYPILQSSEKNVYFYKPIDPTESSAAGAASFQQQVASRNQSGGIDADAIYADPMFVRQRPWWDVRHDDFRLQPNSPALARGFQETNMSLIGIQPGFPFDLTKILGSPADQVRLAADYSRIFKNRITNQQVRSRSDAPLAKNSWTRYNDVDFGLGGHEQFLTNLQWASLPSAKGTAVEIRLDSPDGPLVGSLPFARNTCRVAPTSGLHDVFLMFPNENIEAMNWFVFRPRLVWTGAGTDNKWTTAANWNGVVGSNEVLYFGSSTRTFSTNDLQAGTVIAGITFDADAPPHVLSGNALTLAGDVFNQSAHDQTINLPVTITGKEPVRVDTGATGITLAGRLNGTGSALTKSGSGILTCSGTLDFAGSILIEQGTLMLQQTGLADTESVWIGTTSGAQAFLHLPHGQIDRVGKLFIDGVQMPEGTYGSITSTAVNMDDDTFRGTGILLVQSGPCPPMLSTRADGHTVAVFSGAGNGIWTVPPGVTAVELLLVGGGGGGAKSSGGGGAGGLYQAGNHPVTAGSSLQIAVGAGGSAGTGTANGGNGAASQFGSQLVAYGGIRGNNTTDSTGGNQGGYSLNGGTTIVPGKSPPSPRATGWWSGSGAGAAGTQGDSAPGGVGVASAITGTSRFYAGGGGSSAYGLGGSGIGGNGATMINGTDATAGTPGTGSGGGGGWGGISPNNGGSGIIIVAYQPAPIIATSTALASSANPSTNGQSVVFTASIQANGTTAADATGNFVFTLDGLAVATRTVSGGTATYTTNTLGPGPHRIEASYMGDARYDASNASLTQTNGSSYLAATPVLSMRGDGRKVARFTNTSIAYWSIPAGVTNVEVLVVGGGGSGAAGATWCADGGGGGGMYSIGSYDVTPGRLLPVLAGPGGSARNSYGFGNPGGASIFDRLIAYGGEGGGWTSAQATSHYGGNQGGYSTNGGATTVPGFVGGGPSSANGGGGAGQAGRTGGYGGNSSGGNGLESSITGTATYYAGGGGGGYSGAINLGGLGGGGKGATDGEDGRGHNGTNGLGGGGGASRGNVISGAGGSGVVIVSYRPPTPYDLWKTIGFAKAFSLTHPSADPDRDGLTNYHEFAFGLDPTNSASSNPIIHTPSRATRKFRYTRTVASDLTYFVETSVDLRSWSGPSPVNQTVVSTINGTETIEVELLSPPSGPNVFVRVKAE